MPAELKAVFLDSYEKGGVYLFSYNEVLAKYYCYYLVLITPESN